MVDPHPGDVDLVGIRLTAVSRRFLACRFVDTSVTDLKASEPSVANSRNIRILLISGGRCLHIKKNRKVAIPTDILNF